MTNQQKILHDKQALESEVAQLESRVSSLHTRATKAQADLRQAKEHRGGYAAGLERTPNHLEMKDGLIETDKRIASLEASLAELRPELVNLQDLLTVKRHDFAELIGNYGVALAIAEHRQQSAVVEQARQTLKNLLQRQTENAEAVVEQRRIVDNFQFLVAEALDHDAMEKAASDHEVGARKLATLESLAHNLDREIPRAQGILEEAQRRLDELQAAIWTAKADELLHDLPTEIGDSVQAAFACVAKAGKAGGGFDWFLRDVAQDWREGLTPERIAELQKELQADIDAVAATV